MLPELRMRSVQAALARESGAFDARNVMTLTALLNLRSASTYVGGT